MAYKVFESYGLQHCFFLLMVKTITMIERNSGAYLQWMCVDMHAIINVCVSLTHRRGELQSMLWHMSHREHSTMVNTIYNINQRFNKMTKTIKKYIHDTIFIYYKKRKKDFNMDNKSLATHKKRKDSQCHRYLIRQSLRNIML